MFVDVVLHVKIDVAFTLNLTEKNTNKYLKLVYKLIRAYLFFMSKSNKYFHIALCYHNSLLYNIR